MNIVSINAPHYDRSTLIGMYETKRSLYLGKLTGSGQDNFSFSASGRRLNVIFNGQRLESASVRSWEPVLDNNLKARALNDADREISKTGKILERMLEIAEAAQDPKLNDEERIDMQMEFCELQHKLNNSNPRTQGIGGAKEFQDTNLYKMLERTRDRICSGRKWDVGEVRNTILEDPEKGNGLLTDHMPEPDPDSPFEIPSERVRSLYETEDGWKEYLKEARPEWSGSEVYFEKASDSLLARLEGYHPDKMRSDDENPTLRAVAYVWEVTDDVTVPTVGEILKGDGRSLMDAEAAVVTAEELKKDLKGLEKQREQLVTLAAENAEVQDEPNYSQNKLAVLDKSIQFVNNRLANFFDSLFRDSFQFSYGKKCDIFGQTAEDYETKATAQPMQEKPELNLNNQPKFDVPEIAELAAYNTN